jgi:diguanylate cyclase (GGDEF)-like protein/PAS domain S-box-containing protein
VIRPDGLAAKTRERLTRSTEIELFSLAGHDGYLRETNEAFARLLGRPVAELDGRSLLELVHPDDVVGIVAGLAALEGGAAEVLLESRFCQPDGQWAHLQWVARPLPGTELWWAAGRDTTEFHRLLAERLELRTRLELALGQATAAMWELDLRLHRFSWEAQAAEILDVAPGAAPVDAPALAAMAHEEDADAVRGAIADLGRGEAAEVAFRVGPPGAARHLSLRGKVLDRDRHGRPTRAVGLLLDVSTEKAMEEQMLRMAMSDPLTGVANRRAFDLALRSELRRCSRDRRPLAAVMVDIDDFKKFNDTYGHLVGDDALCAVARALAACTRRAGDTLARYGGEEFAAVLPGTGAGGARDVCDRLVEAVRAVVVRQAPGWTMSVSVGAASWQSEGPGSSPITGAELLARADDALYAAKAAGKNQAVVYGEEVAAGAEAAGG